MNLNNILKLKGLTLLIILTAFSLLTTSCEKDPVAAKEHFEPAGFIIKDGTKAVFMRIFEGKIDTTYNKEFIFEYDKLVGGETDKFEVEFINEDGKVVEGPTDNDYRLELDFADKTIAEKEVHEGEKWSFHIKALKKGETTFEIKVFHLDHSDFRTPNIKLNIK